MHDKDILARILKRVTIQQPNGCWIADGWQDGKSYRKIWIDGGGYYVHRALYEYFYRRKLRKTVQLDHECLNRSCCNPLHLVPMMNKKNSQLRSKRIKVRMVKNEET